MKPFLARLRRDVSGVAMAEFAMVTPILFILAIGLIEAGRMILLTQKLQSGSFILADLAARDKTLSEEQLDNIFLALNNIIEPFQFDDAGTAIVTSIAGDFDRGPDHSMAEAGRRHADRGQPHRRHRRSRDAARRDFSRRR